MNQPPHTGLKVTLYYLAVRGSALTALGLSAAETLPTGDGWRHHDGLAALCAMSEADLVDAHCDLRAQNVPEDALFIGLEDGLSNLFLSPSNSNEVLTDWLEVRRTPEASWLHLR